MVDCKALYYFLAVYSPSIAARKVRFAAIQGDIALVLYLVKLYHYRVASLVGFQTYQYIFRRDYPNIRTEDCQSNQENFLFERLQFRGMVMEIV